jgi:hypothetical protein
MLLTRHTIVSNFSRDGCGHDGLPFPLYVFSISFLSSSSATTVDGLRTPGPPLGGLPVPPYPWYFSIPGDCYFVLLCIHTFFFFQKTALFLSQTPNARWHPDGTCSSLIGHRSSVVLLIGRGHRAFVGVCERNNGRVLPFALHVLIEVLTARSGEQLDPAATGPAK